MSIWFFIFPAAGFILGIVRLAYAMLEYRDGLASEADELDSLASAQEIVKRSGGSIILDCGSSLEEQFERELKDSGNCSYFKESMMLPPAPFVTRDLLQKPQHPSG